MRKSLSLRSHDRPTVVFEVQVKAKPIPVPPNLLLRQSPRNCTPFPVCFVVTKSAPICLYRQTSDAAFRCLILSRIQSQELRDQMCLCLQLSLYEPSYLEKSSDDELEAHQVRLRTDFLLRPLQLPLDLPAPSTYTNIVVSHYSDAK